MTDSRRLEELGARHLWLHFSRMGTYDDHPMPIIDHGEGCWLYDHDGNRYLDALSGLFVVQSGHGRQELADVGAQQAGRLGYFPLWGYAHPPAIELAARLAELSPGDLNRIFFTVSGSEAVESAYKLARQYFKAIGQPSRYKVISRMTAYHGTSLGALSITGVPVLRQPFEPLTPGARHIPNTNRYRPWLGEMSEGMTDEEFGRVTADQLVQAIEIEGPETVAAVFMEPLQNAGGCLTPQPGYFQRIREICDHYGVLLVSDEVICAYGRLGTLFGCERYDYVPDIITTAKGLTSGYSPLGAMLASDRLMEPFLADRASFAHGITFAGHPVSCAIALANLDLLEKEDWLGNVRANEGAFEQMLNGWRDDLPLVGDVRGDGYFWAIELVKDRATRQEFSRDECEQLIRGYLSPRLFGEGLVCRADDRGDPVIQFAPPLIAGPEEFAEIDRIVRLVLTDAWAEFAGDVMTTVGVPREIKNNEYRVAITPDGVAELSHRGVRVLIESGAGLGAEITDAEYVTAGAELVDDAADVWAGADIVCKVKEPQPSEYACFRPGLVLFTYLHLAAYPDVCDALLAAGVTGVAYETVQLADGSLPLLAPMSEVAGRMATQIGAHYLERENGGRGVLLGGAPGVRPGRVVVLGAGNVGWNSAWIAAGMEAEVLLFDKNLDRLRWVDQIHQGRIMTLASNRGAVARAVADADLVIGAVLVAGGRAPMVVTEDMVKAMRPRAVIVDVAIDQGGCVETIHETTHADPVYELHGVLHYAVGNIPGAVPNTSTFALTNATLPYLIDLATADSLAAAASKGGALASGVNTCAGAITHPAVAEALGRDLVGLADALAG